MAKQIIWTIQAQNDRKEIFTYWNNRNKSTAYSKKLNHLFITAVKMLAEFPEIGKPTNIKNVRIKIIRDYLMVYENDETQIHVLTIWDGRRNPEKLKKLL